MEAKDWADVVTASGATAGYGGPPWYATYAGPDDTWERDFDSKEAAQAACEADWEQREP